MGIPMNWKLKCLAFKALHNMPAGRFLHALAQRYVTRRYFETLSPGLMATCDFHIANLRRLPRGARVLEFGCGRNLLTPLLLSNAGAGTIYAYDIERIATVNQVNGMISQLRTSVPGEWPALRSLADLWPLYRILYRAPADARDSGLPENSVDLFCSTSTLEHIPRADIRSILQECLRIANAGALFSFIIDYHDHYGTADPKITRFNFYRYPDQEWRRYNPPNHFQNRLRHSDHELIYRDIGLHSVINSRRVLPSAEDDLARLEICDAFRHYSRDDLLTTKGYFLLSRQPMSARTENGHIVSGGFVRQ